MSIATLIAAGTLSRGDISAARDALDAAGITSAAWRWLDEGIACDLEFAGDLGVARAAIEGLIPGVDIVVQSGAARQKKLLVADMDSTMITVECIDELADYAGIREQIAAVTERAMQGELDFATALDARVALLKGLSGDVLQRCHAERVRVMPGAAALVRTMRAKGARTVLVSGGFSVFADRVAADIGFDQAIANRLDLADGALAGTVGKPIVDAATKEATLVAERVRLGLSDAETLAVGDGANDVPMIRAAGLGIAYRAKPITAAAAHARIDACDLTALLYAQGWPRAEWVEG